MPVLWGAIEVPLWQIDVVRGAGQRGGDVVTALLAGGGGAAHTEVQRQLAPFGVGVRPVPFQDLRRRLSVGMERPEQRILIRSAP